MPNQPYGPDRDRTEIFLESGASILVELGTLLCDLETAQARGLRSVDAADLRERIARKQKTVGGFFKDRPKAAMRKFVTLGSGKEVDPRACRLVGYLAARMIVNGMDAVGIMQVAQGISLTGSPASAPAMTSSPVKAVVSSTLPPICSGNAATRRSAEDGSKVASWAMTTPPRLVTLRRASAMPNRRPRARRPTPGIR